MPDTATINKGDLRQYKVVSLFSGGGGLSLGFLEAGFKVILNTDIDPDSCRTLELNWPSIPFLLQDLRMVTEAQLRGVIGQGSLDVIIGGPPCQGFSNMGDKNGSDPRNFLIDMYIRVVSWLQPTCVLMENVAGIRSLHGGRFYNNICNDLALLGYDVYSAILDAFDYGVPQKRNRLFIFGTRLSNPFAFPSPSNDPIGQLVARKTVREAILDLMGRENKVPNHVPLRHGSKVIARYALIPEGGKLPPASELPPEIRRDNFGNTYERLCLDMPSSTLVPGNNAFPIHPLLNRSLTPREAARIQSFPDNHEFSGTTRAKQCQLVGNAVPPMLSAHVARAIQLHLDNSTPGLTSNMVRQRYQVLDELVPSRKQGHVLTAVDLFSGAGGFTQGFKDAGYQVLLSVDIDKYVEQIHAENHPDVPFIRGDLSAPETRVKIQQCLGLKKIDVLVGGPPCQGFSIFGERRFIRSREFDPLTDHRNNLVDVFWEYVGLLQPDWVIMENVPGFTSLLDGYYYKRVMAAARNLGYRTDTRILNAADYGVPQIRRRFILIATTTDYVIPWPKQKYFENPEDWQKPYRTIGEVLTDLDTPWAYNSYTNHKPPRHDPVVSERFSYIEPGKKLKLDTLPEKLRLGVKTGEKVKNFSHIFRRLDGSKPSTTLVPGHNAFPVHPWLNRTLTIREAARIQTFPDNYVFEGPIINQGLQVGNAFPCLLAQTLAERLRRVIHNKWTRETITALAMYSMLDVNA